MENINYDSLLIISIFAFITPLIINSIKKFKIPFVVGEILVGIIIGKSFLNLVHDDIWINFISHLGLAYLMFLSGLELDFDRINVKSEKKKVIRRIIMCIGMFGISLVVSYISSSLMHKFGIIKNVPFITILLTASAPGLLVPFLKERGILNTDYGQTILIFSLISEFVCLISLSIISSTMINGLTYKSFLFLILFLASLLIYKIIKRFSHILDLSASAFSRLHIGVRAAFALMLVLVTISQKIDTEVVLGSFLAGIIFTFILDKEKEELKYELDIIGYGFLIPIFFIMVGVNMDLSSIFEEPKSLLYIPVFLFVIFIVKLIPSLFMAFGFGYNKAIAGGVILSSQLSVLIVGAQMAFNLGIMKSSIYSAFVLIVLISCILFPICFDKIFRYENIDKVENNIKNKIAIMEIIPLNPLIYNKTLKKLRFSTDFRIFEIIRDGVEILPDGDTKILKGDRLIIAGLTSNMDETLRILNG
ncbi:cation:proton antiporter [Clostridium sp.]|uniref:cation:proton antiporter n=1 Tax=Clostridium sp. TaxID=1506 RepID=UPI001A380157|nr:cation:proton antiporter [Clostridium sp.]MBK5240000.1 cation:proton antiporter [Clostridium sp.]